MNEPRSPWRALLINVLLFAVAFGLLTLVLYQNRTKIAEVFAKPVDYRFFGIGMAIYLTALLLTFFRWYQLVRRRGWISHSGMPSGWDLSAISGTS